MLLIDISHIHSHISSKSSSPSGYSLIGFKS